MTKESAQQAAEHFLKNETAFHLGEMLTEQSHPVTRGLSQVLAKDTAAGIDMLLRVDDDLPPVIEKVFASEPFQKLRADILATLRTGNRIFFSGCGATGRLSILLDAAHRRFCAKKASLDAEAKQFFDRLKEQTFAIMTGGDFALIRSVESFEDFIAFGKRQMYDAKMTADDCLVAISEGGETSSVIGTIHAALELGAKTSFLFNNPSELMARMVERSKTVIEDSRVNVVNLTTGPMAVAGSTRMQATTIEMLAAGLAFESALDEFLRESLSEQTLKRIGYTSMTPAEGLACFKRLLAEIRDEKNRNVLAALTDFEHSIYAASGLVTYFPDEYALDIFTDTTERSPTFKIPPFRSTLETEAPVSWAFVKEPLRDAQAAWLNLLGREPCCIEWTPDDYRNMGAPDRIINNPPKIDRSILKTYLIGCEPDPTRTAASPNVAVAFLVGNEIERLNVPVDSEGDWLRAFLDQAEKFEKRTAILIGHERPEAAALDRFDAVFFVETRIPETPMDLFAHIAMKIVLNNVSTATMGKLGRLNGNWMAHVDATNKKLIDRSIRLISELAGIDYASACYALFESIEETATWTESRRKTISPAAYTIERLCKEKGTR